MSPNPTTNGMAAPLRVESGELTTDEIIDALNEGRRVVVETEVVGSTHTVTLRMGGGIYYCDTPTTLHKHETEAEMRTCITRHGYARD